MVIYKFRHNYLLIFVNKKLTFSFFGANKVGDRYLLSNLNLTFVVNLMLLWGKKIIQYFSLNTISIVVKKVYGFIFP